MAKKREKDPTYYHGGFGGISVGEWIDPPSASGRSLRSGYEKFDSAYVFVTTSLELATAYAHQHARLVPDSPGGAVYEVNLKGPKESDEDFAELAPSRGGPFSFRVDRKLQVRRVVTRVVADSKREFELFAPYQTWHSPDGKVYPMWDERGYLLPNPVDAANGVTQQGLEADYRLGPFPGKDVLIELGLYSV